MDINEAAKAYNAAQAETANTWAALEQARDYWLKAMEAHSNARACEEQARQNVLIAAAVAG
jgi:hypothetical protein